MGRVCTKLYRCACCDNLLFEIVSQRRYNPERPEATAHPRQIARLVERIRARDLQRSRAAHRA